VPRPQSAQIVYVERGQLMVADASGRHAVSLLPPGYSQVPNLVAVSDDGSTLAMVVNSRARSMAALWVSRDGVTHNLAAAQPVVGLAVSADGTAVYFIDGAGALMRWSVGSGTSSPLCLRCGSHSGLGSQLAVSPDAATVAVSTAGVSHLGVPPASLVEVWDTRTGQTLWTKSVTGQTVARAEAFADNDTLVETVGDYNSPDPMIHEVSGLHSGHPTDTVTGVQGYGPIRRLDGVWWYYRDSASGVTTVYVNPALTPAAERRLVDRVDGPTTLGYLPVRRVPRPVTPPPTS
jgi:hypothetical protein